MEFSELSEKAIEIRNKYSKLELIKYGREWSREEIYQGFVGDVGDLAKLVMAKSGIREKENVNEKIAHELSDCLWSILVLAKKYDVNLEKEFLDTMAELDERIEEGLR